MPERLALFVEWTLEWVFKTSHFVCLALYCLTSCPARRCSGILAPLSSLASWSIAQPTDNPIEKLCSALIFCWLKKKGRFRMVRHTRSWLLPHAEALWSVSRYLLLGLPCGDVLLRVLRVSVQSVPLFPPFVNDQRVRVAGNRPSWLHPLKL